MRLTGILHVRSFFGGRNLRLLTLASTAGTSELGSDACTAGCAKDTYLFGRRQFSSKSPKLPEELSAEAPNFRPVIGTVLEQRAEILGSGHSGPSRFALQHCLAE